jgi:hypothetical protein
VPADDNPYVVAQSPIAPSSEEAVRRSANLAAIMAGVALLVISLAAPVAAYFGHKALAGIKRDGVGEQHRGAAMVGVVFGWIMVLVLVLVDIPQTVKDFQHLVRRP